MIDYRLPPISSDIDNKIYGISSNTYFNLLLIFMEFNKKSKKVKKVHLAEILLPDLIFPGAMALKKRKTTEKEFYRGLHGREHRWPRIHPYRERGNKISDGQGRRRDYPVFRGAVL